MGRPGQVPGHLELCSDRARGSQGAQGAGQPGAEGDWDAALQQRQYVLPGEAELAGQLLANSFAVSRTGAQPSGQRKSHQSLLSPIVKVALQALARVVGPVDQL